MFSELVMVGPSPRYIDDGEYHGGFSREQIDELLEFLNDNHLGWSAAMAPAIMGNPERPELSARLENSFCNTDPQIAQQFAKVTFLSDNRDDLPLVRARTSCSSAATTSSPRWRSANMFIHGFQTASIGCFGPGAIAQTSALPTK